jgi:hypothetical protein
MKPRTAGVLGIIAALIITVYSGALIATPPFSILGALGLVGGTVLLVMAASWMARKSWGSGGWPVYVERTTQSTQRSRQVSRSLAFVQCAVVACFIFVGFWQVLNGNDNGWITMAQSLPFALGATSSFYWLAKEAPPEEPSQHQ